MLDVLKRWASLLPDPALQGLRKLRYADQIRRGRFRTDEAEFDRLGEWVGAGDWVLDVGANIGHYALRLSELVGASGRVFAFEPIPSTFEILAANVAGRPAHNVTLFNVAASREHGVLSMHVPRFANGLDNHYMAQVGNQPGGLRVLGMPIDALGLAHPVRLAKLDVEGHELEALEGMEQLLRRDHPVLIVEGRSEPVARYLGAIGYSFEEAPASPNRVFHLAGRGPDAGRP